MEVKGSKVLIFGAAKSGIATAKFLASKLAKVTLTDLKDEKEMDKVNEDLKSLNVGTIFGKQPDVEKINPDLIIVSPGVPLTIGPLIKAKEMNVPIISEMELAYSFSKAPFVAITGTNGKTTTTALVGQIFKDAKRKVLVGGNIGVPLIDNVEEYTKEDVIVAEASSFQLETTKTFKPKVSAILNITPDHLDRHGSVSEYTRCKAKIFDCQDSSDFLVLNYDDEKVKELALKAQSNVLFFSRNKNLAKGVYLDEEKIIINVGNGPVHICDRSDIKIKGNHNLENAMAAIASTYVMGVDPLDIKNTLMTFKGVSHRLEPVGTYDGVKYINDSKGTNPDASIKALESFEEPIVLIAGGKNKGSKFDEFAKKIREKVKELVLVGAAKDEIKTAVLKEDFTNYHEVVTFKDAVLKADELAEDGDVVLLSPACASWDMFNSYEERGDYFKKLVHSIRR